MVQKKDRPAIKPEPAPRKRIRLKREDRRRQLFEVAERIIAHHGVGALNPERLAIEAKVTKPVIYSHFDNRSDLLVSLAQEYWDAVDHRVPQRPDPGEAFEAFIRRTVHAYFDFAVTHGGWIRQAVSLAVDDPRVDAVRRAREQRVVQRMASIAREFFRVSSEEAVCAALLSRGALQAAAIAIYEQPALRQVIEDAYVHLSLTLLSDRPSRR